MKDIYCLPGSRKIPFAAYALPNLFTVYQIEAYSDPSYCLSPMLTLLLDAANCLAAGPPGHPAVWRPGLLATQPSICLTRPPGHLPTRWHGCLTAQPLDLLGPARWRGPALAPTLQGMSVARTCVFQFS